ncbi:phosphodiesterase [Thiocapsa imhoffii]|uniref:Phosphodiesterase n=1 Tax=Thiocapsa imhoffii TaxID=382777 RepID=A0A9X0WJ60_9GAMM|nr:alkaline phosphatase family protein [Thiocapsa imhoffii]MBK1645689.1 phosphodiesterase [Thiocapsa imhoffii]
MAQAHPPWPRPDYLGGSILNLMSSLIQARGGHSDAPGLSTLPPRALEQTTNLVLFVIDGLGADWLARSSPRGLLERSRHATLTTVFPTTTAAAIPTFLTGEAPLRHGLTGWHTYIGELGAVMTVLPGRPRCGGAGYRAAGIDPLALSGTTPVPDRIQTPSTLFAPREIARSDFNLAYSGRAETVGFKGLEDLFQRAAKRLRRWPRSRRAPCYLYLYWPTLDTIGHAQGIESAAARAHLLEIEAALQDFLTAIAGTDTLVLVTADHGHIDTGPDPGIDLAEHPALADSLLLPLCGEPRAALCYLRSGRRQRFIDYCQDVLADRVDLIESTRLLEEGYFGLGARHPRIHDRIGDVWLLPKGRTVIRQWLPFEKPYQQIGVHGGLSDAERLVPLSLLRA